MQKLDLFVYDNKNLEILESKLNEFNPFNVLKVDEFEIRHSNFLAWVLDPSENHRLSDYVLKKFIKEIIIRNENKKYSINETMRLDLKDAKIYRELNNIDVLVVSESNKLVVVIENKIKATESKNQLKRYLDCVKEQYPEFKIIPVFLTRYGDEPSEEEYAILSYESVYDILKFTLEIYSGHINQKIQDFISDYARILEVLLMKDEGISKLCKQIYQEHKEAIDLIVEYSGNSFEDAIKLFLDKHPELVTLTMSNRRLWFLPKKLKEELPSNLMQPWPSEYPVAFWFSIEQDYGRIGLKIEVGPFKDPNKRSAFLEYLRKNDITIKDSALNPDSRYTRVFSKSIKFEEWGDNEKMGNRLNELYMHANCQSFIGKITNLVQTYYLKEKT